MLGLARAVHDAIWVRLGIRQSRELEEIENNSIKKLTHARIEWTLDMLSLFACLWVVRETDCKGDEATRGGENASVKKMTRRMAKKGNVSKHHEFHPLQ